jgi:hypothetical protein
VVLFNRRCTTALGVFLACVLATGLVAQDKKPEWKSRDEYDLYDSAAKDTNAASRLATLDRWRAQYGETGFLDVRQDMYMITYQQLVQQQPSKAREGFNMAIEILGTRPNYWRALSAIVGYAYLFPSVSESDLEIVEKGAQRILDHLDEIYAPANKPPEIKDPDWAKQRPEMKVFAQRTLAWIYLQRKDNARLESESMKCLALDSNQAQVSYWLAGAIASQVKEHPERYPVALYHYARAAAYDGPGALVASDRQKIRDFVTNAYGKYHGSADGFDQLLSMARASALPGPEWPGIESASDIAKKRAVAEEEDAKRNPMLALWRSLRKELTGDQGNDYFENSMKGALLPGNAVDRFSKFRGKLVSMTPEQKPKEVVLAIEDGKTPDVTLRLDGVLPGKMEPGAELEFEGIAASFTKDPFMVIFEVEKSKLVGWTGKNAPSPNRKKSAGTKKAD